MLTWKPHPVLKPPTDDELAAMEPQDLVKLHSVYHEAIANAERDPYRFGFKLPHWTRVEEELGNVTEVVCLGGNRCLAPEQEIYDPVAKISRKVCEITDDFYVMAWDGAKQVVAFAKKPFQKHAQKLFRLTLSNGQSLACSGSHVILTPSGWRAVSSCAIGDLLVAPVSAPNTALQPVSVPIHRQSIGESDQPDTQSHCASTCADCAHNVHIVKIDFLREDTVWDFTVPVLHNYIAGGVVNHNSGKTRLGAFMVVKAAAENPGSEIFCFAQTSEVSIRQQQSAVWEALPVELRQKQTSAGAYIAYTRKNGFTDSSLILPNGSQIIFKTYTQYANNQTILEGAELGSKTPKWHNIGAWLDEYLIGPELINTLRFRLATREGKLLLTFTPIDGYTEVIKEYLDCAHTVETKQAELLNGETVPYVQRSAKRNASIHYFHSQDNPFGGYDRIKETLIGRGREEILIRAYGVPVKSHATKFPRFNSAVNVVDPATIPTRDVTRYHIIDPAGSKNWFMCWIAVDASDTYWVYREWPGVDVGDWAEWKGGKWLPGEGSKGQGLGINDYVDLIAALEEGEDIYERLIDPRLGSAKYQGSDGSSSIIEDLAENGVICIPAPGLDIEDGLQALIGKMSWDTSKPLDSVNRPHFYVSNECENIIHALGEYTGEAGLKEAWKDPIDVLRYAAVADIDHFERSSQLATCNHRGGY